MDKQLDLIVQYRANYRCEYCHLPQSARRLRFQIDHIIAEQHGGGTILSNLALCCGRCNRHKGPNLAGIDQVTGQMTRLLNPRTDRWDDHFAWERAMLVGKTDIGRVTINVLAINDADDVALRVELIVSGKFHPTPRVAEIFTSGMPMSIEERITALDDFKPHPIGLDDEYRLIRILAGFDLMEDRVRALPAMFSLMERCPEGDLGSPGPMVHAIESLGIEAYQAQLEQSVHRRPMYLNLWMVNRILNTISDPPQRQRWIELLHAVKSNPDAADMVEIIDPILNQHQMKQA